MNRYVCVHGHFYQPPRENPWLEEIETQDSAYPYHDWNERVNAECYAPNTASRILDDKGHILNIINNYSLMSFNFGPTLLSWMEKLQPEAYQAILEADQLSQKKFFGHGAALAQAYSHMIMPLANPADKRTQVIWGIKDFEFRFKRKPEGMWLPETAVDVTTLEILADQGITFTILSPYQAKRARRLGSMDWYDAANGRVDPQKSYLCRLPSGKSIVLLFYDGPISRDVAFSDVLTNGGNFARRLLGAFPEGNNEKRLVNIATDGETYGHHHRFGNMALSYCLYTIEKEKPTGITIYAEFLANNPPQDEVEVFENSSWSCAHGVERWRSDCGCCIGGNPAWNQKWRAPLRETLDWLRDKLMPLYEREMKIFCPDPWGVRDEYIVVILDRSRDNVDVFLNRFAVKDLSSAEKVRMLKLLEMQRHAMLMFTSCGWFFDDIAGIESTQIIQYAARAIQLAKEINGIDLEPEFLKRLENAPGNTLEYKNGALVYQKKIKPDIVDLLGVGAHYAISSLFEDFPEAEQIYCYTIYAKEYQVFKSGKQRLAMGQALIRSETTWEEYAIDFAVLHFGDYNINGGVRPHQVTEGTFAALKDQLKEKFQRNNIPEVIQLMNEHFGEHNYSLWDLFKNEQGKILNEVFNSTLESIETHLRGIYEYYYPLMQVRPDFRFPLPKALSMTVEFIINRDMVTVMEGEPLDLEQLEKLVREMKRWSFTRDKESLAFVAGKRIDQLMAEFVKNVQDFVLLRTVCEFLRVLEPLALPLNFWRSQNIYFSVLKSVYPKMKRKADDGDQMMHKWMVYFDSLGKFLKVKHG